RRHTSFSRDWSSDVCSSDLYVGVFRANQVLHYTPNIAFANEEDKARVIGQAEFLRALWYFQIAILWEKGALVLEPKDASYKPEEVTEDALWAQVETDLKNAYAKLPPTWDDSNTGRATIGAAKALLAKAYMQQGKFAEAKSELQWLIDQEGALYGLMDDYMDNFTHFNENNKEGVF